MRKTLEKLPLVVVLACLCFVLAGIFLFRPFFGPMDDSANLFLITKEIQTQGFWHEAWLYAVRDISWGMFRITNTLMIGVLYPWGLRYGPEALFLVNGLMVIACVSVMNYSLAKITKMNFWHIWLLNLGFFYFHDLFLFPSLQEKMILLFGGLLLLACHSQIPAARKSALIFLFAVLGVVTKASFCIYLAVAALALWCSLKNSARAKAVQAMGAYLFLVCISVFFLAWVSKQGMYTTGRYSLALIRGNIFSRNGAMLCLPALLFLALFLRRERIKREPEIFLPTLGVLSFLAIFLPWSLAAYISTVIAPLFCVLILQLLQALVPKEKAWLWLVLFSFLALGVSVYRTRTKFLLLHDMGSILASAKSWEAQGIWDIYAPCEEGSGALARYFQFWENSPIRVHQLDNPLDPQAVDGKVLFYDQSLCPLPGRLAGIPACRAEILFSPSFPKSYRLEREICSSSGKSVTPYP